LGIKGGNWKYGRSGGGDGGCPGLNCSAEIKSGATSDERSGVIYLAGSGDISLIVLSLMGAELAYNDL